MRHLAAQWRAAVERRQGSLAVLEGPKVVSLKRGTATLTHVQLEGSVPRLRAILAETYLGGTEMGFITYEYAGGQPPRVDHAEVHPPYRRAGLATAMWRWLEELVPDIEHSSLLLPDGDAWINSLGSLGSDVWFRGIPGAVRAVQDLFWAGDHRAAYEMVRGNVENPGNWWSQQLGAALRFGSIILVAKGDPGKASTGMLFPNWQEGMVIVDVLIDTMHPEHFTPVLGSLLTGEVIEVSDGAAYGGDDQRLLQHYASGSFRQGSLSDDLRAKIMAMREEHGVARNPRVCGTFSYRLQQELGLGRQMGFFRGGGIWAQHAWNTLPDGTIVDATADQFKGYPAINVVPANSPDYEPLTPEQEEWLEWFRIDTGGRSPSMEDWAFWKFQYEDYVKPGITRFDPMEDLL